ncbi:hypothetical protein B0H11DRAFT_2220151 [Mycena galericulata]|nr:hypothetical protein B0H11DRAFT_2220151 [Mycena galericulata]
MSAGVMRLGASEAMHVSRTRSAGTNPRSDVAYAAVTDAAAAPPNTRRNSTLEAKMLTLHGFREARNSRCSVGLAGGVSCALRGWASESDARRVLGRTIAPFPCMSQSPPAFTVGDSECTEHTRSTFVNLCCCVDAGAKASAAARSARLDSFLTLGKKSAVVVAGPELCRVGALAAHAAPSAFAPAGVGAAGRVRIGTLPGGLRRQLDWISYSMRVPGLREAFQTSLDPYWSHLKVFVFLLGKTIGSRFSVLAITHSLQRRGGFDSGVSMCKLTRNALTLRDCAHMSRDSGDVLAAHAPADANSRRWDVCGWAGAFNIPSSPSFTGTSVLAINFKDGVMMAAENPGGLDI